MGGDRNTTTELTLYCSEQTTIVDTFAEDKTNIFSYPDPVETFEETCKGIGDGLFQKVMAHDQGNLFNKINEIKVKKAILIAAKKNCSRKK